jgi:hypothetical protein
LGIATSFPATALIRQHNAIATERAELDALGTGNKSLQNQADELSKPENVDALARREYDMVQRGQKAYTVLPNAGSGASADGGNSLDQGSVAPGSSESQSLTGVPSASAPHLGNTGGSVASTTARSGDAPDLWVRVLDTLEFWR